MNWCLYLVTHDNDRFSAGDAGVFMTSIQPGINDAPYGTLYICPKMYVDNYLAKYHHNQTNAELIREAVLDYFRRNYE